MKPSEQDLWDEYRKNRIIENRNKVAEFYGPMVSQVAKGYFPNSRCGKKDFRQEATAALILAIEKHDPRKGKFKKYATGRIHTAIRKSLRDDDDQPERLQADAKKYKRVAVRLEQLHGQKATSGEVVAALTSGEKKMGSARAWKACDAAADKAASPSKTDAIQLERESDTPAPGRAAEISEVYQAVALLLGETLFYIVRLLHIDELSASDVAIKTGLSEQTVRNMNAQAMHKCRSNSKRLTGEDYCPAKSKPAREGKPPATAWSESESETWKAKAA